MKLVVPNGVRSLITQRCSMAFLFDSFLSSILRINVAVVQAYGKAYAEEKEKNRNGETFYYLVKLMSWLVSVRDSTGLRSSNCIILFHNTQSSVLLTELVIKYGGLTVPFVPGL